MSHQGAFSDLVAGSLAAQLTQIIELGPVMPALFNQLYLFYTGGMDGKDTLYAHTEGILSYDKGLTQTASAPCDYNTLKYLYAFLFLGLLNLDMHTDHIAGPEGRNIPTHFLKLESSD
jgi:hypothetical protein